MQFFKVPNIQFMKYKYVALGLTLLIVLAGFINIVFGRGLKLGVDFGEGTLIRVIFKAPASVSDIRGHLASVGLGNSVIQSTGKNGREFMIRTMEVVNTKEGDSLESHQVLGNKVIDALKGTAGPARGARGLKDLNSTTRHVAALLDTGFPGKGEELAQKITSYRTRSAPSRLFGSLGLRDRAQCPRFPQGQDVSRQHDRLEP